MSRTPLFLSFAVVAACSSSLSVHTPDGLTDDTANPDVGDDDDDDDDDDVTQPNRPPEADAGPDLSGMVTEEIELQGSGSDPDGDTLSYEWVFVEVPGGSTAQLLNETRANASFYADRAGRYIVELAVDDGIEVATDSVQVTITAPNAGPVANAGLDQNVPVGNRVLLNGSSSYDPDADPLDYAWTFAQRPGGSNAILQGADTAFPQFTADQAGTFIIELVVTDGVTTSSPDQVRVVASEPSTGGCFSCSASPIEGPLTGHAASGGLLGVMLWLARRRRWS
ncbi:MAG: hypothetical protein H6738_11610 [Alphaproteobacteria bacterium]|nr:hypothetical protein [Alphaproteobacteria bacterium]MCB9697418.1 hypothetical protein [Alphaproteobacteria bacterium]